ncbi:hypothetical protein [Stigmatella aurantiaca]|uniref:Uncharacterized protein n=1 Tax=Stigmatella aurantiaca (strain DW4/3-1) TaxID=378806 RepID=Q09D77_STIAD|nr:hypothetical protein [Stigmatella aurantiaca]ADO67829.1 uncharacterized protein STAUR_0020 [Stigmatella aurantiaca DW4/3-1]EAU69687.1 hypothetical protein STIAU_2982 [Stigmatella aurantiaca DW4/3-1]
MAWTFELNITNGTKRRIVLLSKKLSWGYWNRDGVEGQTPIAVIEPNATVHALGVKAARGTWTGYEFSCSWKDDAPPGEKSYGTLDLSIDVPYSGSNKSSCTATGGLRISGWDSLPASGHNFVRSIVILAGPQKPKAAMVEPSARAFAETDPDELAYQDYQRALKAVDVEKWSDVDKKLKPIKDFIVQEHLPANVNLTQALVARSEPVDIEQHLWGGIGDPDYPNPYAQELFVKRYFAVAIHSVATNNREIISLVRTQTQEFSKKIQVTSSIKNVLETTLSIKKSLTQSAEEPLSGTKVASTLNMEFGVKNVLEVSTTKVSEETIKQTFTAPSDKDMLIVPWVFSTAVLIYHEDIENNVNLIAASEWAETQIFSSYVKEKNDRRFEGNHEDPTAP